MWHILPSHKMLMSLLAFCFQQEILYVCLIDPINKASSHPKSSGGNLLTVYYLQLWFDWLILFLPVAIKETLLLTLGVSLDLQLKTDIFCKHEIAVCCHSAKNRYASMPCSYQSAEGFAEQKCLSLCFSALSRLQTSFYSLLCDAMIGSKFCNTWPRAIIIRYMSRISPSGHNASFFSHSICRLYQFCRSSCCMGISAVSVWKPMWFNLNKTCL